MTAFWTEELLGQLELHVTRQLRPRLVGLTDEEYFWEPAPGAWGLRWRVPDGHDEPRWVGDFAIPPPDPPPVTTIGWRLRHVVGVLRGMRAMPPFDGEPLDFAAFPSPGTADGALAQLGEAIEEWTAGVRALGDGGLAAPAGSGRDGWSVAGVVLHVHREVIHHGAEIALLRDLHALRARERNGSP